MILKSPMNCAVKTEPFHLESGFLKHIENKLIKYCGGYEISFYNLVTLEVHLLLLIINTSK